MHDTLLNDVKLHVDSVLSDGKEVYVSGWCISQQGIGNVRLRKGESIFNGTYGGARPDVVKHYKNKNFSNSGFSIIIPEKFKDKEGICLEVLKKNKWTKAIDFTSEEAESLVAAKTVDEILKISDKLQPSIITVENFYENPDEVRKFALSCDFKENKEYHKGSRTDERYLPEGAKELFEKHLQMKITKWEEHGANGVFQYCIAQDALVYHVDMQSYAAMVYLAPDAPPSCGTTLYRSRRTGLRTSPTKEDEKRLGKGGDQIYFDIFKNNFYDKTDLDVVDVAGNVYNRLIIFNAQAIHAASEYFGNAKENSRLFQIFFFDAE